VPGSGFLADPWWVPFLWVLLLGHITNLCVTLYLHRSATHEGVIFHPVVRNGMRFWLWLTTGMVTKEWVAVHRKHHAFSDRDGDPHSPAVEGVLEIVFGGVFFYRKATRDRAMVEKYGAGCPDDWFERNLFQRVPFGGLSLLLLLNLYLFGVPAGLVAWVCSAVWMPIIVASFVGDRGRRTVVYPPMVARAGKGVLGSLKSTFGGAVLPLEPKTTQFEQIFRSGIERAVTEDASLAAYLASVGNSNNLLHLANLRELLGRGLAGLRAQGWIKDKHERELVMALERHVAVAARTAPRATP